MNSRNRKQAEREMLDFINNNPPLLSLLYDLNLLPEQTLNDPGPHALMVMVCVGFRAGVESKNRLRPEAG